MSDNRITCRYEESMLKQIDKRRTAMYLTRPEFVRQCVSDTLTRLDRLDDLRADELKRLELDNQLLRREVDHLNQQLSTVNGSRARKKKR